MNEHEIQKAIIRHCRTMALAHEQYKYLFAVPNGGQRDVRVAKKLKAEGVLAGVSDLVIPWPTKEYNGAFIEVKTESGRPSDNQLAFIAEMSRRGYYTAIVYGLKQAIETFDEYLLS